MSTQAIVSVVDENGASLNAPLVATLIDISGLFDSNLGAGSLQNGKISIGPYNADDLAGEFGPRKIRLSIFNGTLLPGRMRLVRAPIEISDTAAAVLDFGTIMVAQRDATGWAVTLGLAPTLPFPYFSQGNAARLLVDDEEAWGYIAQRLGSSSTTEVDILQLEIDVPKHNERGIVLQFSPPLDQNSIHRTQNTDSVLETLLAQDAATPGVIRVLMDEGRWSNIAVIVGEAALLLVALPVTLIMAIANFKAVSYGLGKLVSYIFHSHPNGGESDIANYFATPPKPTVLGFARTLWNRIHAKIVMLDQAEVIVTGSPFIQNYFDSSAHAIDEPRRGWHPDIPVHDVSLGVRGPAVNDMHETYRQHWNQAAGSQVIQPIATLPEVSPGQGEYACSLQLIRTINGGAFPSLPNGEQGVLEAYLRAIENASDYIYFENQYFTNEAIANAVVAALKAKPALYAILLVNVIPDIPFYAQWQSALIKEMRTALSADANRLGAFTIWSQEAGKIMPNYVHAKVGIIDDKWATVGSANLDGASIDYFQVFHALQFGDNRNHELNYIIFNGSADQPATGGAVEALRRRLWSEHLGYANPTSSDLNLSGTGDGSRFMALWRSSSQAKVASLTNSPENPPTSGTGRVIEYPGEPTWDFKTFLTSSGISVDGKKLRLLEEARAYSFKNENWIT